MNLLDGAVAWKVPGGNNSSAAISQDYMAVFTGPRGLGLALYKLSPRTGELLWSVELPNRESSPLIYNGHVYAIGGGQANCVDLSTREIVDGKLYMRLQTGVSCYDLTSDRSTRILPVSEQHKQKKKSTR